MHLGTMADDPIPEHAEWISGLGWAVLNSESRARYQALGTWDAAIGVPRLPRHRNSE